MDIKNLLINKLNKSISHLEELLLKEGLAQDVLVVIKNELHAQKKQLQALQDLTNE
jgi:hypothetical protein